MAVPGSTPGSGLWVATYRRGDTMTELEDETRELMTDYTQMLQGSGYDLSDEEQAALEGAENGDWGAVQSWALRHFARNNCRIDETLGPCIETKILIKSQRLCLGDA